MTAAVELALCRSAIYQALALGFAPPSAVTTERLANPEGAAGLAAAARVLEPGLAALADRLAALGAPPDTLRTEYQRLFGHIARAEVPAFETEYGADDLFRQPQELADIGGFYRAFGLAMAGGERPDHVRAECEFLMVLTRREAAAHEQGDTETAAASARAARLFLRDHLGRFLPSFGERLQRADPDGFYGALGALAEAFVEGECRRADVPLGPTGLALRQPAEDGVPMACGSCGVDPPGFDAD